LDFLLFPEKTVLDGYSRYVFIITDSGSGASPTPRPLPLPLSGRAEDMKRLNPGIDRASSCTGVKNKRAAM